MGLLDDFAEFAEFGGGWKSPYFHFYYKRVNLQGQIALATRVAEQMHREHEPLTRIFKALTGPTFDLTKEIALEIIKQLIDEK